MFLPKRFMPERPESRKHLILLFTHSWIFPCFPEFHNCSIRSAKFYSGIQFYLPDTANRPNTQPNSGCTPNSESATQTQISSTQVIGNPAHFSLTQKSIQKYLTTANKTCELVIGNSFAFAEYAWKGKWSLGLMPFGLKSFGLIQLVTWLKFFKLSVSGISYLA